MAQHNGIINRSAVRDVCLRVMERKLGYRKFSNVSKEWLDFLEADFLARVQMWCNAHPNKGKTLKRI